jgi:hypothetical protein
MLQIFTSDESRICHNIQYKFIRRYNRLKGQSKDYNVYYFLLPNWQSLQASADKGCQLCVMMRHSLQLLTREYATQQVNPNLFRAVAGFAGSWVYLQRYWDLAYAGDEFDDHDTRQPIYLFCESMNACGKIRHIGKGRGDP